MKTYKYQVKRTIKILCNYLKFIRKVSILNIISLKISKIINRERVQGHYKVFKIKNNKLVDKNQLFVIVIMVKLIIKIMLDKYYNLSNL
jgi:hypothetical protein